MRSFELSCILKGHNRCRKHKNIKFAVACNGETSPRSQIIVCHVAAVLCQGLELGRVWLPRHVTLPLLLLLKEEHPLYNVKEKNGSSLLLTEAQRNAPRPSSTKVLFHEKGKNSLGK